MRHLKYAITVVTVLILILPIYALDSYSTSNDINKSNLIDNDNWENKKTSDKDRMHDPLLIERDIKGIVKFKYVTSDLFDPGCEIVACKNHRAEYTYLDNNIPRTVGASVLEFDSEADARNYLEMYKSGYSSGYILDSINNNNVLVFGSFKPTVSWLHGDKIVNVYQLETIGSPPIDLGTIKSLASSYIKKYPSSL